MASLGNGSYVQVDGTKIARVISVAGISRSVAVVDVEELEPQAANPLRRKLFSDRVEHDGFEVTLHGDFGSGPDAAAWIQTLGGASVAIAVYSPDSNKYWSSTGVVQASNSGDLNIDEAHVQTFTIHLDGNNNIVTYQ